MARPSNTVVRPKRNYFDPNRPFVEIHDDVYVRQETQGRCGICGKNTFFKSRYAVEHVCSVECSNELWCQISESVATTSARRKRK
jgi:hypothetical protein